MTDLSNTKHQEPSLLSALKVVTVEWLETSTAHAIPNIARTSNTIVKLVWIVCFLASLGYCFYSMVMSVQEFLSYPSYISTEVFQEIPASFPAVTICNMKTVNKTAARGYFSDPKFQQYLVSPNSTRTLLEYALTQQYYTRTAISNDTTLTEGARRQLGFQLKEMLMGCIFNYEFCNAEDFVYSYDPNYGNCYTFNKGIDSNGTRQKVKSTSTSGPLYGLVLELFLGDPAIETAYENSDGVLISIHNQSTIPFTNDARIMASTNAETDVLLSKSFMSKLEYPYGDCLKDTSSTSTFSSFYFDYIVRTLAVTYTQKYCFALCLQKYIMNTCKCTNTFMPIFKGNNTFCLVPAQAQCNYAAVSDFSNHQANKDCQAACPFECDSVEYETSTSRALFPTMFYQKVLSDYSIIQYSNISYENIPLSVAKVNIYYKHMLYKTTTEVVAISTESFFSNMGGTLGLYIGISLLSFIEIVELAILVTFTIISHSRTRKKINSSQFILVQPTSADNKAFKEGTEKH